MFFWIAVLVSFIALCAIFYMILKSALKAVSFSITILFILSLIFGTLAIIDARDFADSLPKKPNLVILEENGKMLAAVKDIADDNKQHELTKDEFIYYSALYEKKDYKGMLGNKYKMFVVKTSAFDGISDNDFAGFEGFARDVVFDALRSENSIGFFVNKTVNALGVTDAQQDSVRKKLMAESPDDSGFRSTLFNMLLKISLDKEGPLFMLREYQKGNAEVYPETMLFRAIGVMPESALDVAEGIAKSRQERG